LWSFAHATAKQVLVPEESKQAFHLSRLDWFGISQRFHVHEELAHEVKGESQIGARPHGMKGHEKL
jgi:hypothetical protein